MGRELSCGNQSAALLVLLRRHHLLCLLIILICSATRRYLKIQSTVGIEDAARLPQAQLLKKLPRFMDWLLHLNHFALVRVLFGKPLLALPALLSNARVGRAPIADDEFARVILPALRPGSFTPWVYFYHHGRDM